jgi:hypothetical protein
MKLDPNQPRDELALFDGSLIVRVRLSDANKGMRREEVNRNVFRLRADGNVMWQVAAQEPEMGDNPFVAVELDPSGKLVGYAFNGWQYEIDVEDGSLRKLKWSK